MKIGGHIKILVNTAICVFAAMMVAEGIRVEISGSTCGNLGPTATGTRVTLVSAGDTAWVHDALNEIGDCSENHSESNRTWDPVTRAGTFEFFIEGPFTAYWTD